jgi:DNA-binding response OmpR family regulator
MKRRVLVVEDDPATRQMISVVLSREAFAVDTCVDDVDTRQRLEDVHYDAVVLALVSDNPAVHRDILLQLSAKPEPPPVIVISAGTQAELDFVESSLICARLRKPFQLAELVGAVHGCFSDA